jgi:hypothetical protein
MIDPFFWIDDCKYILSVKVHRSTANWTVDCADAGPGGTRDKSREKEAKRVAAKRAEDAKERDRAVDTRVELQTRNLELQEGLVREFILSSKKKRESASVNNLKKKLKMLEKHKSIFIKKDGEEAYEAKVAELLYALLAAGKEDEPQPPVTKNNEEEDGCDDNGSSGGGAAAIAN